MSLDLKEIEEALKGRTWLSLEADTLHAWLKYTRELENKRDHQTAVNYASMGSWSLSEIQSIFKIK